MGGSVAQELHTKPGAVLDIQSPYQRPRGSGLSMPEPCWEGWSGEWVGWWVGGSVVGGWVVGRLSRYSSK